MQLRRFALLPACLLLLATTPLLASSRTHRSATRSSKHAAKPKVIGQRGIDDTRATQLQAALIKAGYLTGEPSGHWDASSEAAMTRLQAANGWQTKLVPDSRAIIKLGLGPNTVSTTAPAAMPPANQTGSLGSTSSFLADQ